MPRAGLAGSLRPLERSARVPQGPTWPPFHEMSDQLERPIKLWRERNDGHCGVGTIDRLENFAAARTGGQFQMRLRLRAAEFLVDEVTFEMRPHHARPSRWTVP